MRLRIAAAALVALFCSSSASLPAQQAGGAIELTRQAVETQKRFIIGGSLPLTEQESLEFWPLFNELQEELKQLDDRRAVLITEFVGAHGALGDKQARKLLDEFLSIEERRVKLQRKYVGKMSRVLPGRKLARYFQLENKLDAVVEYDLAQRIPLAQ